MKNYTLDVIDREIEILEDIRKNLPKSDPFVSDLESRLIHLNKRRTRIEQAYENEMRVNKIIEKL